MKTKNVDAYSAVMNQAQHVPVHNMDNIAMLPDDELVQLLHALNDGREKARAARKKTREWEEEICYVRREFQIRKERRELHEAYLAEYEEEAENARLEDRRGDLPSADLDNIEFVNAWMQWVDRTVTIPDGSE